MDHECLVARSSFSLVRALAEALRRSAQANSALKRKPVRGLRSCARAPPHTPPGRALERRPGVSLVRARARAKRSSEDDDPTEMVALASIAASSSPAERSAQPMTELTIPTNPIASTEDHCCIARSAVLSVPSASGVVSVVSVLSEVHGALAQGLCQFCRFCHRCNVRRNRGFVSSVRRINGSPLKKQGNQGRREQQQR